MRPIGRYQLRVRTLLLVPAVVALSCWLAVQAVDHGDDYQQLAAVHAEEALFYQTFAQSAIPDTIVDYTLCLRGQRCGGRDRPTTEAEKMEARRSQERAGRLAAYHFALRRKYALAALVPWLPLTPDPLPPE
jgi:hypothetical protein